MAIMVEDTLLIRRDSALIEEDVGKENADLLNRNYGNLCLSFFCWPVDVNDRWSVLRVDAGGLMVVWLRGGLLVLGGDNGGSFGISSTLTICQVA